MELRELKSFVMAARYNSVSKAANELGLGQPTVTTHIKKLENELSMVLFDRVTRPIKLTLWGKTILELVEPLLDGIEMLAVRTSEAEERGPVTVAATPDIIPHTLLRVVRVFNNLYPNVFLKIKSSSTVNIINMVKTGEIDAGIIQHTDKTEDLNFEGLFLYERVLIAPKGHELLTRPIKSLDVISEYPLILMAFPSHTREILEAQLQKLGRKYEVIMELDSLDMIKKYVALGMGISVGPKLAIEQSDLSDLGIVSLANFLPVHQAGVITLPGKNLSNPAEKFLKVMRDTLHVTSGIN